MPTKPTEPDLGIELPVRPAWEIEQPENDRKRAAGIALLRARQRPPYPCVCGLWFDTPEEIIDHRHPMGEDGRPSHLNFEQTAALAKLREILAKKNWS